MIFRAFEKNPKMSVSIKYLNMSGSKFEVPGSQSMNKWFFSLKAISELRVLKLSSCALAFQSLRSFKLLKNIEEVDFSGNRVEQLPGASTTLCQALELFPRVKRINLANCDLSETVARSILKALSANTNSGVAPYLVLGGNTDLKGDALRELPSLLDGRVSGLNIAGLRMRDAAWVELVRGLARMNTVAEAVLDDSVSLPKDTDPIVAALRELIAASALTSLSIANSFGKRIVAGVLPEVAHSTTLTKLDVSGNSLGDSGVREVADMIKENAALRELCVDANHIRIHGFLALCAAFSKNDTLEKLTCADDAYREYAALAGPQRTRLVRALAGIHSALVRPEDAPVEFWFPTTERCDVPPTPAEPTPLTPLPASFLEQNVAYDDAEDGADGEDGGSDNDGEDSEDGGNNNDNENNNNGEERDTEGNAVAPEGETEEERKQREREKRERKEREKAERKERKEREKAERKEREKAERAQRAAPPQKPVPVVLPTTILSDEDIAKLAPAGTASTGSTRRSKVVPIAATSRSAQWTVKASSSSSSSSTTTSADGSASSASSAATAAAAESNEGSRNAPPSLRPPPSLAAPPELDLPGSPKETAPEEPVLQLKARPSSSMKRSAFARNPRGGAAARGGTAKAPIASSASSASQAPASPAAPAVQAATVGRPGLHHKVRPGAKGMVRGTVAAKGAPAKPARPGMKIQRAPLLSPKTEEETNEVEQEEQENNDNDNADEVNRAVDEEVKKEPPKTPSRKTLPPPEEENEESEGNEEKEPKTPTRKPLPPPKKEESDNDDSNEAEKTPKAPAKKPPPPVPPSKKVEEGSADNNNNNNSNEGEEEEGGEGEGKPKVVLVKKVHGLPVPRGKILVKKGQPIPRGKVLLRKGQPVPRSTEGGAADEPHGKAVPVPRGKVLIRKGQPVPRGKAVPIPPRKAQPLPKNTPTAEEGDDAAEENEEEETAEAPSHPARPALSGKSLPVPNRSAPKLGDDDDDDDENSSDEE